MRKAETKENCGEHLFPKCFSGKKVELSYLSGQLPKIIPRRTFPPYSFLFLSFARPVVLPIVPIYLHSGRLGSRLGSRLRSRLWLLICFFADKYLLPQQNNSIPHLYRDIFPHVRTCTCTCCTIFKLDAVCMFHEFINNLQTGT